MGGWQDDGARRPASARATLTRNEEKVPLCRGAGQNISPRPGKRSWGSGASPHTHTHTKKPNTKTKRSLTVCIIDALKKSRAPRHMCPSPAAVRRYPNVTLMAPGCGCNPFAAEAVTSLFEQQNWKFRRQTNIIHGWKGSLKSPFCSRAQHVFCTQVGGSWPGPIGARRRRASGSINS